MAAAAAQLSSHTREWRVVKDEGRGWEKKPRLLVCVGGEEKTLSAGRRMKRTASSGHNLSHSLCFSLPSFAFLIFCSLHPLFFSLIYFTACTHHSINSSSLLLSVLFSLITAPLSFLHESSCSLDLLCPSLACFSSLFPLFIFLLLPPLGSFSCIPVPLFFSILIPESNLTLASSCSRYDTNLHSYSATL